MSSKVLNTFRRNALLFELNISSEGVDCVQAHDWLMISYDWNTVQSLDQPCICGITRDIHVWIVQLVSVSNEGSSKRARARTHTHAVKIEYFIDCCGFHHSALCLHTRNRQPSYWGNYVRDECKRKIDIIDFQ